jgi:hypothetical protein
MKLPVSALSEVLPFKAASMGHFEVKDANR